MATYVLIHGAGGSDSWYWHLVAPKLRDLGHEVIAPDLPVDDPSAGLGEFAKVVVNAVGDRSDVVLVAQSMAGFTAPIVCEWIPVDLLVLVAAMVPVAGETAGAWWSNTGHEQARRALDEQEGRDPDAEFDPLITFMHDLPADVAEQAMKRVMREQSDTPFMSPWPLDAWPTVPTRFLLGRLDRLFPAEFMRRIAWERLGIVADEMESGHLPALSRPTELVERLEAYRIGAASRMG